jgi:methylase of polypeptide subunit release factors
LYKANFFAFFAKKYSILVISGLNGLLESLGLLNTASIIFRDKNNAFEAIAFSHELKKKVEQINPDAIYVFNEKPYILFFDLEKNEYDLQLIFKQSWSFDSAPLVFVIDYNSIEIFNAFNYNKKTKSLEAINVSEDERTKLFSFWSLESGNCWKWLQENYYQKGQQTINQKRVHQRLFDNIKEVRSFLIENSITEDDANILILRIIFIRYLIDRDINIDNSFISGNNSLEKRQSFYQLLNDASMLDRFFRYLNERFNGVLFRDFDYKLSTAVLNYLRNIFDARADKTTPSLFDQFYFDVFDFSIIPVEVISGIYESLIDIETRKLDSAVYTPAFLVEYILHDTIDNFIRDQAECTVLDPSCGSGIFLVQALRRMIDKEIDLLKKKPSDQKFSERIRQIARNRLFGIDINPQSLKVTCFSIYIALLDYQKPKDIDVYAFPTLIDENLFQANFFDQSAAFNQKLSEVSLDFILGNPPWKSGKKDKYHVQYLKTKSLLDTVSDFQLAQSFICRAKDFCGIDTTVSFVVTSKAIYNLNAAEFRTYFLTNFLLVSCFDLSPVRRFIFEGADNPAMILNFKIAQGGNYLNNVVRHLSLKYNIYLKYFKSLVLEKFDQKKIVQELFITYPWMFKVALYGGILDFNFLKRLTENHSSFDYILTNEYNIVAGNGVQKGSGKDPFKDLIGLPIIETDDVKHFFTPVTSNTKRLSLDDVYLERGRDVKLFNGDKLVITRRPKKESDICVSVCLADSVFRSSVYIIPLANHPRLLSTLFSIFTSRLYTYFQFLTASNWGIYHPEINKAEYLAFPYWALDEEASLIIQGLFNEFLKPIQSHYQNFNLGDPYIAKDILENINKIINEQLNIVAHEEDLIDYAVNISRYQFQGESKQKAVTDFTYSDINHYRNQTHVLTKYADLIISELGKIYLGETIQAKIFVWKYFIAIYFSFSTEHADKPVEFIDVEDDDFQLIKKIVEAVGISSHTLAVEGDKSKDLYVQKDIKGFEQDGLYIVKPNEYKCWHRAMAWYDLVEIKEAIEDAEINYLNESTETP